MFRNNRKYKGVLCSHKSCTTIDELLSLIPSNRIQEYDDGLEGYHDVEKIGFIDPGKIEHPQIRHFQFLSDEQYFPPDTFNDEKMDVIKDDNNYKYNIYIMELQGEATDIFITAPYWEIISEIDELISKRLKGRILYCYAASEEVIQTMKEVNLDGSLTLSSGTFHVGGVSKIRKIQLNGVNILKTNEFSFIFENPEKYVSTKINLRYTKGNIKTSLYCETTGRFSFNHPTKSQNLEYILKIIEYLIDNKLLKKTEIKPFKIRQGIL